MARAFAEIAFTPETLALQEADGSAAGYARLFAPEIPAADALGPKEAAFVAERDGFYQASVSSAGWPYVQFRGGPKNFLKALDPRTLGYADLRGNRQHLSAGNILHDRRVSLFLMDYAAARRLKIWGEAELLRPEDHPDLARALRPVDPRARVQRLVRIRVRAFDWNCPQHIPRRLTAEEIAAETAPLRDRLAALEAENERLRRALSASAGADPTALPQSLENGTSQ